ncbi:hypothetical protein WMY93_034341, partial [Mugilogobius chulae]
MAADLSMDKTREKPIDLDLRSTDATENTLDQQKEREMVMALKKACATAKKQEEQRRFIKELTVVLELEGGSEVSPMALIRAVKEESGNILACRQISKQKYEVTVTTAKAKERLLDGFRIGETKVHGRDVTTDELVVSFMGLPAYIKDEEIEGKLLFWGVTPVSEVRRRMWPGTTVADGTRWVTGGGGQEGESEQGEQTEGDLVQLSADPSEPSQTEDVPVSLISDSDEASGQAEAAVTPCVGSASTQKEGAHMCSAPNATAEAAEPGRGMGAGTDPHLTLEGERQDTGPCKSSRQEGGKERGMGLSHSEGRKRSSSRKRGARPSGQTEQAETMLPTQEKTKTPLRTSLPVPA